MLGWTRALVLSPSGCPKRIAFGLGRRPAAFDEVSEYAREENENEQREKPGPPAVSCDQHVSLRCWGIGPSRSGQCSSIHLTEEKRKLQAGRARHPENAARLVLLAGRTARRRPD